MPRFDKPDDEISKRFAIPPPDSDIKNPFSPASEPSHVGYVSFAVDHAAVPQPHVVKLSGWRRVIFDILAGVTIAGAAGAGYSPPPPRGPVIVQMMNTATPSGRTDPPAAPPLLFTRDVQTPAHDDTADPFGQIVKKVVEEMVDMAIEECFGFVAHLVWAAYHARRGKLTEPDREALATFDLLLGTDHAWIRSTDVLSATRAEEPPLTEEDLLSRAPEADAAVWRDAGEQFVKAGDGPLRPFLCGDKSPVSSGVEKVTDWIAGQTRDALFHGVFDEALLFAVAGLAVMIGKQGLDTVCGPEKSA